MNQDWNAKDNGWVEIRYDKGAATKMPVMESGTNTGIFTTRYTIPKSASGKVVEISYGYLGFKKAAEISIEK